jgi:hypothetical protein
MLVEFVTAEIFDFSCVADLLKYFLGFSLFFFPSGPGTSFPPVSSFPVRVFRFGRRFLIFSTLPFLAREFFSQRLSARASSSFRVAGCKP